MNNILSTSDFASLKNDQIVYIGGYRYIVTQKTTNEHGMGSMLIVPADQKTKDLPRMNIKGIRQENIHQDTMYITEISSISTLEMVFLVVMSGLALWYAIFNFPGFVFSAFLCLCAFCFALRDTQIDEYFRKARF